MNTERGRRPPRKSAALFFPFDLFGSAGAGKGAELLADAFREMLEDNKRERKPTRARAYAGQVRMQEFQFENVAAYHDWRQLAREAVRRGFQRKEFLFWVTGNHLGTLPVYEELAADVHDSLVIQFDAHLDIYHLSDCTDQLSHGNFLLHAEGGLPAIINVGSRELLLTPDYAARYYQRVFSAADLAADMGAALAEIRRCGDTARRVFLDIDCDVIDSAYFPAVTHPTPFGIDPPMLLRLLDAAWSDKVVGIAVSEFDPARDVNDKCLATLLWLMEWLLLKHHESA